MNSMKPHMFDGSVYWVTGNTLCQGPAVLKPEKPPKLPSLKTAAANYKKAQKALYKAGAAYDNAYGDVRRAEIAKNDAERVRQDAQNKRDNAEQVLLQVAGK